MKKKKKRRQFVKQYNQKICFFINKYFCYYKYFVFNMKEKNKQSILSIYFFFQTSLKVFFIPKVNFHLFAWCKFTKACHILEEIC